jgi:hypothetical protein
LRGAGHLDASACRNRATAQFGKVEYHRCQASMNIPNAKSRSEPGENRSRFARRFHSSPSECRGQPLLGVLTDTEIRPDQQVQRRVLGPIRRQFFDLQ